MAQNRFSWMLRMVARDIHENLFWAFAYNTALIPLAAGALYPAFGILLSPAFEESSRGSAAR